MDSQFYKREGKSRAHLLNDLIELQQEITKLEEAKQVKKIILDAMTELIVYQDVDHKILWANKAVGESSGMHSINHAVLVAVGEFFFHQYLEKSAEVEP